MNSNDINSIIDNICNKLGTTASKLIPEMAGYQIAKHSIWLAVSLIFIGLAIILTIKLLRLSKDDQKVLALYREEFKSLDKKLQKINYEMKGAPSWAISEWKNALCNLPKVTTIYEFDSYTYAALIFSIVLLGFVGAVIFGISLHHIIGWHMAPNASAFMWIINHIGGGQ